jgi:glycine/D-amino acid oxidase-like deaminating enzyme
MQMGTELLGPGEHPFPSTYVNRGTRMRIEPSIYLEALVRDVTQFGGRIVIRKFETLHDLMSLTEPIIVNSTGLGSRALFGDEELTPVKGQLTFLVPQPELNYILFGVLRNSEGGLMPITVMPRRDGIALGTTGERGVWTLEPNEESRRRTVEAHIALSNIMRSPRPHTVVARSQRLGKAPALETFFDLES